MSDLAWFLPYTEEDDAYVEQLANEYPPQLREVFLEGLTWGFRKGTKQAIEMINKWEATINRPLAIYCCENCQKKLKGEKK